jgi:hypothetical protein
VDDRAQIGARYRYVGRRKRTFQRRQQAGLAGDRGPLGPDDRQRQKIPVVAFKPRKETGAQKRRFSRAGCAEDNEEPRRRGLAQSAQPVERLDDRAVATKEDDLQILDQHAEQPLVQVVRQMKFPETPTRTEPCFRDEKQHRLATVRRLVERALPALSGSNAALRVEIEEDFVLPALAPQPIAQADGLGVIHARMA